MNNSPAELDDELTKLTSVLSSNQNKEVASKGRNPLQEHNISFSSSFLIEMVNFIKKTLSSINNINLLSIDKYGDLEFRKYARKSITSDIKNIDSMLNALLNYININTPIIKKHTIHFVIDDILDASNKQIQEKNIKIVKKFEEDLPETYIHDEQVKFILNSIVQYLLLIIPSDGTIGFLTRSRILQKPTGEEKVVTLKERQYVEILIMATVQRELFEEPKDPSEILDGRKEQSTNLILRLIKELIQKHQGLIEFEVEENKKRTLISVRFPVERRQVILYEQINL